MAFRSQLLKNKSGFTLIELLIVIAIIGILAAIAIPQFNAYKKRAADADVKSNLHQMFLACKAYWGDTIGTNICNEGVAKSVFGGQLVYGFIQSANVNFTAATGTEDTWAASAQHTFGQFVWNQDFNGNLFKGAPIP